MVLPATMAPPAELAEQSMAVLCLMIVARPRQAQALSHCSRCGPQAGAAQMRVASRAHCPLRSHLYASIEQMAAVMSQTWHCHPAVQLLSAMVLAQAMRCGPFR